jgi:hypothetical protein
MEHPSAERWVLLLEMREDPDSVYSFELCSKLNDATEREALSLLRASPEFAARDQVDAEEAPFFSICLGSLLLVGCGFGLKECYAQHEKGALLFFVCLALIALVLVGWGAVEAFVSGAALLDKTRRERKEAAQAALNEKHALVLKALRMANKRVLSGVPVV